jgi:hypothetical protein
MQHVLVVNVLESKQGLREPTQDLFLWDNMTTLFAGLDLSSEVSTFAEVHEDTEPSIFEE